MRKRGWKLLTIIRQSFLKRKDFLNRRGRVAYLPKNTLLSASKYIIFCLRLHDPPYLLLEGNEVK